MKFKKILKFRITILYFYICMILPIVAGEMKSNVMATSIYGYWIEVNEDNSVFYFYLEGNAKSATLRFGFSVEEVVYKKCIQSESNDFICNGIPIASIQIISKNMIKVFIYPHNFELRNSLGPYLNKKDFSILLKREI